jgi:hypothetical protein
LLEDILNSNYNKVRETKSLGTLAHDALSGNYNLAALTAMLMPADPFYLYFINGNSNNINEINSLTSSMFKKNYMNLADFNNYFDEYYEINEVYNFSIDYRNLLDANETYFDFVYAAAAITNNPFINQFRNVFSDISYMLQFGELYHYKSDSIVYNESTHELDFVAESDDLDSTTEGSQVEQLFIKIDTNTLLIKFIENVSYNNIDTFTYFNFN